MPATRDSIHRNIDVEPWALDLMDTKEMQRLRHIRQLGTAYLVYPGANHTRFEHSLGAMKLAQDACRALRLTEEDGRAVQAAALLHDLGHGPLSHLFEEVFKERNRRHEEFTVDLVQWSTIADRLARHDIPAKTVADLVLGKGELGRIVSGDVDVDRMDYLLRDAHYTGLRTAVDPERLLSRMRLVDGAYIADAAALTAIEGLLMTRFLMYPSVYFHHTCRSAEQMLVAGIEALLEAEHNLDSLRVMDDRQLFAALEAGPPGAQRMVRRVLERRLYKRAYEGRHSQVANGSGWESVGKDPVRRRALAQEIAQAADVDAQEVLVDWPRPPLLREVAARMQEADGTVRPVSEVSTLVRTLMAAQMDHWRFWVFAPTHVSERVAKAVPRAMGLEAATQPQKG